MRCDLHTHSIFSDGSCTPTEIVKQAKQKNLVVALTDHNTVSGLPEFMSSAEKYGVTAVGGVEFSTSWNNIDLHILGLFIDRQHYDKVTALVKQADELKRLSNIDLVEKLRKYEGFDISYDEVENNTPDKKVNRTHIAKELFVKGYVHTMDEAFKTVLSTSYGLYVKPKRLDSLDTVKFIKSIGAVPVLAHPFLNLNSEQLEVFLPQTKEYGLAGMETMHSKFSGETMKHAKKIAEKYNLLESGGSDFHGNASSEISIGTGIDNNLNITYEVYEKLCEYRINHLI